jgi:hypothetical protein
MSLRNNIPHALLPYVTHRFLVYDRVAPLPQGALAYIALSQSFLQEQNLAYIPAGNPPQQGPAASLENRPQYLSADSENFRILAADANSLKIQTNFPAKKFFVYNDSYHPLWQAWINGQPHPILPANLAFKGLWVEAGKKEIVFRFGTIKVYAWNYFLFGIFYAVLISLLFLSRKNKRQPVSP